MDYSTSVKRGLRWNSYLFRSNLDSFFLDQLEAFIQGFEKEWNTYFNNVSYQLCQLESGNRLRPMTSFLGYLISEHEAPLTNDDLNKIIEVGICIELIHKSSLIIDDMVDGDTHRKGKVTFHIANGQEKAVAVASHLISRSFKLLMEVLNRFDVSKDASLKCIEVSINILNDMSMGLLKELSMDTIDFSNIELTEEIIRHETASIIKNSLLIGYLLRGGDNQGIINCLNLIGENCGYIFQVANDIEPFRNSAHYQDHKRKDELEFFYGRKNIVSAYIIQLMSPKEKEELDSIKDIKERNSKLSEYFHKHDVYAHFVIEIEEIKNSIHVQVDLMKKKGVNKRWCLNCKSFIDSLVEVALSRL